MRVRHFKSPQHVAIERTLPLILRVLRTCHNEMVKQTHPLAGLDELFEKKDGVSVRLELAADVTPLGIRIAGF